MKKLLQGEALRRKILQSVEKLDKVVGSTLGPGGRTVILHRDYGGTTATKDGVSVAREFRLLDPVENIIAQIVTQAAVKTAEEAGDGTTTSIIITNAIIQKVMPLIIAGYDLVELKKGITAAKDKTIEHILTYAKKLETIEEIKAIATISVNNDEALGSLIAEAFDHIGADGIVTVDEAAKPIDTITYKEGTQFDTGYFSSVFKTLPTGECILERPYVLLSTETLSNIAPLTFFMEVIKREGRSLVIITPDITNEALSIFTINKVKGSFSSVVVKAPYYGELRKEFIYDLAAITGATPIDVDVNITIDRFEKHYLGTCDTIQVTAKETVIFREQRTDAVEQRIKELKELLDRASSTYEKDKIKERLAKLSSGIAVINIGAQTEIELKEKKHRVEDALSAVRSALQLGIVPGGGTTLIRCAQHLETETFSEGKTPDFVLGFRAFTEALYEPFKRLIKNASRKISPEVALEEVKNLKGSLGYIYRDGTLTIDDTLTQGVIDPAKVTISVIQFATSVAESLLSNEAILADYKDDGLVEEIFG